MNRCCKHQHSSPPSKKCNVSYIRRARPTHPHLPREGGEVGNFDHAGKQ